MMLLRLACAQLLWQPGLLQQEQEQAVPPARTNVVEPRLCDASVHQKSGYIAISDDKKYFFWLFESRHSPASDPVVMWLTGGPGCSSQLALLAENGPCNLNGTDTVLNPYSWNGRATMLWVDQPAGTGFSEASSTAYTRNETQVGDDMLKFLTEFFKRYPSYNHDFFVFGESYGGHWVPVVTHRIFQANARQETSPAIALKGFGIGNGLTDPVEQYKYYAKMAYDSGSAPRAVTAEVYEQMLEAELECEPLLVACNAGSEEMCEKAYVTCNTKLMTPFAQTGLNTYDMRVKCLKPPLCYDFSAVDAWLNVPAHQAELGLEHTMKWQSCNFQVNALFQTDFVKGYEQLVPPMLEAGLRVLIYAGDVDFICNWLGNRAWTLKLDWSGHDGFNAAPEVPWRRRDGQVAGKLRSYSCLSFLQVFEAGHMVPLDQPMAAQDLFNEFLAGTLDNVGDEVVV